MQILSKSIVYIALLSQIIYGTDLVEERTFNVSREEPSLVSSYRPLDSVSRGRVADEQLVSTAASNDEEHPHLVALLDDFNEPYQTGSSFDGSIVSPTHRQMGQEVAAFTPAQRKSVVAQLVRSLDTDEIAQHLSPKQQQKAEDLKPWWKSCCCSGSNSKGIVQVALDILSEGAIESDKERHSRERLERIASLIERALIKELHQKKTHRR